MIDTPYFAFSDDDGLRTATASALREGFAGKAAIHPRQIPIIDAVFTPTDDEVRWAHEVVAAAARGAGTVDGEMVDEAVARRACRIIDRHRLIGGSPTTGVQ